MGNIELTALFKYLWAAFIPAAMKGWSMTDKRFRDTEEKVEDIVEGQGALKADIKVLVERTENQDKLLSKQEVKLDAIYSLLLRVNIEKEK
jgi:hypothetical protein